MIITTIGLTIMAGYMLRVFFMSKPWNKLFKDSNNHPIAPTNRTQRILLLGPKGAGKTTLWKMLKGEPVQKGETMPTIKETHFRSFKLEGITIVDPIDLGGDKFFQNEDRLSELVKPNTFIFILFDIHNLSNKKEKEYLSMLLCCILKFLHENREKIKNVGINLVVTCCDAYSGNLHINKYVTNNLPQIVKTFLKESNSANNFKTGDLFDGVLIKEIKNEILSSKTT